jgi:hypothetical protein
MTVKWSDGSDPSGLRYVEMGEMAYTQDLAEQIRDAFVHRGELPEGLPESAGQKLVDLLNAPRPLPSSGFPLRQRDKDNRAAS